MIDGGENFFQHETFFSLPAPFLWVYSSHQVSLATFPISKKWLLTGQEKTMTVTSCFSPKFTLTQQKE